MKMLRAGLVISLVMLLATVAVHAQEPSENPDVPQPSDATMIEVETVVTQTDAEQPTETPVSSEPVSAPTVAVEQVDEQTTRLTFQEMGFETEFLRGTVPSSRVTYQFGLPANWVLSPGSEVIINLTGSDAITGEEAVSSLASIDIEFNGVLVDTFLINWTAGSTLTFSIPEDAVVPSREDGRHELTISYDPLRGCDGPAGGMMVDNSSVMQFQYRVVEPSTDLRLLPRPFYQRSFETERVQVVLPADPSEAELEAAMRLVASLGHSTFGGLQIDLITTDALTPALLAETNLILVGKASAFADLELDTPDRAIGVEGDKGLIWMAISPWNPAYVVMAISGETDEAVRKAGLAVSRFQVRPTDTPDVAVVSESDLGVSGNAAPVAAVWTLKDQGYTTQALDRVGMNEYQIPFTIPPGKVVGTDAYFDLYFNHSRLLAYDESGVTILLNDVPIGSILLADENANLSQLRFPLPASLIQPGQNYLTIRAEMRPTAECYSRDTYAAWFTIHDNSVLSLPLADATVSGSAASYVDLNYYPQPFSNDPTLNSTLLLLPRANPAAWDSAANLIFNLGDEANGSRFELAVAYADSVAPEMLVNKHLILVGMPDELPQVAAWNDSLPAFFPPESKFAVERDAFEVYEQSPERSVAYVEMIQSPASPDHQAVLVLGTDNTALQNVSLLMSDSRSRSGMLGNLVILDQGQLVARNVRLLSAEPLQAIGSEPSELEETASQGTVLAAGEERKTAAQDNEWIPDFMKASSIFMVSVVGFALLSAAVRTRRRKL